MGDRDLLPQTNPAFIQIVLDDVATSNCHAAANRYGISSKTVYRWQRKRDESGGTWPTAEDVEAWAIWRAANGARQRRSAAIQRAYKKKVYLQRGPVRVDGTGTRRRLQALYALGWTGPQLAARLGVSPARVGHLTTGLLEKVNRETAAKVAALYDELSMVRPEDPPTRGRTIRVHDRQRKQSAAKGWAPPLAWDDIDDPDETPTGWEYAEDRAETIRDLVALGENATHVARALGLNEAALARWCRNNGLRDEYRILTSREGDWNSPGNYAHTGRQEVA